jgi:hypothetical protein
MANAAAGDDKLARPASLKRSPRPAADDGIDPVHPHPEIAEAPKKSAQAGKKRGPYNVQRVDKRPASYRLPPDVIELIDQARAEAAARGDRLTKDEAVTMAVRSFWGGKRQRRQ